MFRRTRKVKHRDARQRTAAVAHSPRLRVLRRQRVGRGSPSRRSLAVPLSLQALAALQGVAPISDPTRLLGNFWPANESADDFLAAIAALRAGRHPRER